MIIESFVSLLVSLITFIGDLFGTFDMPGWWTDVDEGIDYLMTTGNSFGNWIPMSAAARAIGLVVTCLGIALGIKLVRIVASFFTAGGGSAA